jgi:hypothetical protein
VLRACAWGLTASFSLACSRPPANPACCDGAHLDAAAVAACCDAAPPLDATPPWPTDASAVKTAPLAGERFIAAEGCARDMRVRGPLGKSLAELGRLCAQGMKAVDDVVQASVAPGESIDASWSVASRPMCLRVGVVATSGDLSIALEGPGGLLAEVRSSELVGLLPVDGPICVREPGLYRATVHLSARAADASPRAPDGASVALQIWASGAHER